MNHISDDAFFISLQEGPESGYEGSGSYPPGQQPPWSRGQQGQRIKSSMSREILRHKIEVFNNNAQGLIMSLVSWSYINGISLFIKHRYLMASVDGRTPAQCACPVTV